MKSLATVRTSLRPAIIAAGIGALGFAGAAAALAAETLGGKIDNDMRRCAPGSGPAVRLDVTGLKSASGNLFVRTYRAKDSDWLKSRRYLHRIDTTPRKGNMTVCVPLPAAGDYAIVVQHDINGNYDKDFSIDGAGMSNNPEIRTFLGIPRPPALDKTRFRAGEGVTRIAIQMKYQD
ncbi:DUF2141 domain-containing protein [Erythrobacter sanguineus]|jgi:uncharacterized protein (DUF2141 family)|uniref:Uncharacterized conserved protein, DUF2141 family n=1 Tax=Erythrobacter sanguineus TaxID=198312 RepID=A0A1M7T062_9SPHN|nr:DUF2141 domain-containing protein [Erythrobacter sanguineus]MCR9178708.1 DUF2141 domain-containing protein [Erythrobacteraceae bacterium]SHN64037.1 Uncharacterized conserved protein, DUF2141 family [Erythrobacter sanguineus]